MTDDPHDQSDADWRQLELKTLDDARPDAFAQRKSKGFRTARQNLCDPDSFVEYGQLAVAAQRQRRTIDELRTNTPADGIITRLTTINAAW
jgi:acetyl-CoA carboxylase carboxyltransferase component